MRAVLCSNFGEPSALTIQETEEPMAAPGQVIVEVVAAGLGFVDGLLVRGEHQTTAATILPFIPGNELSGRIVSVGLGVSPERIGELVVALAPGALAERVAITAHHCIPIPKGMDMLVAAGAIASYCTNVYALESCGALRSGETVMVLGASGGVGGAAIDLASGLGARVVACASTPDKLAIAAARGADILINYSVPDWRASLLAALGPRSVDVVYDPVGGGYSETALRCLGPGGRHLVVGFAAGEIPRIKLNLVLVKRCSIVGVDLGGELRANPDFIVPVMERFMEHYVAGRIRPEVPTVHDLDDSGTVMQDMLERRATGKQVIQLMNR